MVPGDAVGLFAGAVALGAIHGIEPGHGWPVAASYALDRANKWVYGFAAGFILGVGHLVSSIAMVGVFFHAKSYFNLTQVDKPITFTEGVRIGGPVSLVAGVMLIALGVWEYRHGHSHGNSTGEHDHGHDHPHTDRDNHTHEHEHDTGGHRYDTEHGHRHGDARVHDHDHEDDGRWARLAGYLPVVGGGSHDHGDHGEAAGRGLLGIAWFAFLLGFAHEEEFEIIALCAGSPYCLELMGVYAITVIAGIVGLTMLLIAGYQHYQETVERYTPYLPALSATVLISMGVGFIVGLL